MSVECKHTFKLSSKEIFSPKEMYYRKYECKKCGKDIEIKTNKRLLRGLRYLLLWVFVFISNFYVFVNVKDVSKVIVVIYVTLIIVGFYRMMTLIVNLLFWLFQKKIKYVLIEEKNSEALND